MGTSRWFRHLEKWRCGKLFQQRQSRRKLACKSEHSQIHEIFPMISMGNGRHFRQIRLAFEH
jgi:hypothetical protein